MRPHAPQARPRRRSPLAPHWPTVAAALFLGLFISLAVAWIASSFAEVAAATIRPTSPPSATLSVSPAGEPTVTSLAGGADAAWALAACAAARPHEPAGLPPHELTVAQTGLASALAARRESIAYTLLAADVTHADDPSGALDRPPFGRLVGVIGLHEIRAGFPFHAWSASAVERDVTMIASPRSPFPPILRGDLGAFLRPGVNSSWTFWPSALGFALPYRPIWPGLLADAAFYALLYLLLRAGILALRGLFRRGRSLCPDCAYPLGEYTTCPECGRTNRLAAEA